MKIADIRLGLLAGLAVAACLTGGDALAAGDSLFNSSAGHSQAAPLFLTTTGGKTHAGKAGKVFDLSPKTNKNKVSFSLKMVQASAAQQASNLHMMAERRTHTDAMVAQFHNNLLERSRQEAAHEAQNASVAAQNQVNDAAPPATADKPPPAPESTVGGSQPVFNTPGGKTTHMPIFGVQ